MYHTQPSCSPRLSVKVPSSDWYLLKAAAKAVMNTCSRSATVTRIAWATLGPARGCSSPTIVCSSSSSLSALGKQALR